MLKSLATEMRALPALAGAVTLALAVLAAAPAHAAEPAAHPERQSWSWSGPFGLYDRGQLQRGYKVYRQACAACHGMNLLAFRNLGEAGGPEFSEAEVRAIAADHMVVDGPDSFGEMFERSGVASDRFPSPFPNEAAARAANAGAYPPDLSVMAKAREGGADYLYALMLGYEDPPANVELAPGMHYNRYFPGGMIAMPPPLSDGLIEYTDGTAETLENYSRDVTAFMMWAAEPKMEERKRIGFQVMIFLFAFSGLLYLSKRKLWRDVDH